MRLTPELQRWQQTIEGYAAEYGLDFYETVFEILSYDELNEVAAFGGFPTRYPHWRFGMQYEQLAKGYEYGTSKIYELVINNDPCYAYLMSSNPMVDQKLVMAHVYGHCDFFKNNYWFSFTNRKMVDEMANHATKIRRMIDQVGLDEVEEFIDVALSVENLIDHMSPYVQRSSTEEAEASEDDDELPKLKSKDYMDSFINPPEFIEEQKKKRDEERARRERATPDPVRDVLSFLIQHAPLKPWQVEVLEIVRSEAYYFNPQAMTKIMNEGWASYWHQKMMTERILNDSEVIDYAETMAGTLSGGAGLNPYQLGLALYHEIEERWNKGRHGIEWTRCDDAKLRAEWNLDEGKGREKIFEVRRHHNDVTFVDEFLSEDFCHRHKLFLYAYNPQTQRQEIASRDFEPLKAQLLRQITNGGHPVIEVTDENFGNRGELVLTHRWEENDLKDDYARATLTNLRRIWSRPVHLETMQEGKAMRYSCDEEGVSVAEC